MNWMQTASGRAFDLANPRPEDVDFHDIAHALSQMCRFAGHTKTFYSVAEHCVRVAQIMPQYGVYGLLHDAHEAYVGDITTPVALSLASPAFGDRVAALKGNVDRVIYKAAGLVPLKDHPANALVGWADKTLMMTERRDLLTTPPKSWGDFLERVEPLPDRIEPWTPERARNNWLNCAEQYGRKYSGA